MCWFERDIYDGVSSVSSSSSGSALCTTKYSRCVVLMSGRSDMFLWAI